MFLRLVICVLVGTALAGSNPGFRDDIEYTYIVRGRTLASLHEISNQYSGILLKAKLILQLNSDENLIARISEAHYGQIHTELPEGWNTPDLDEQTPWTPLNISEKPFKIVVSHGVVQDVVVDGTITNWEANVIRSIISQFQLDTKGQNIIPSPVNTLPNEHTNTATFKTMEDTVTGNTETLYDIHLIPEVIVQSEPWLAPKYDYKLNENILEIIKHKNYTNSAERPSYHFGLFKMGLLEPTANQMGDFYTRSSISRIIATGTLNRFTIQNSYTVNKMIVSPVLTNKQKGSVVSVMNVTLAQTEKKSIKPSQISNPVSLGNLVYRYNQPFGSNKVRPNEDNLNEQEELISSEESLLNQGRFRRSVEERQRLFNDLIYSSIRERYAQKQQEPQLHKAPESPMLPMTMGLNGISIKQDKDFDSVETVKKLANDIGDDLQKEDTVKMLEDDILAKFVNLATLTRIMDAEPLKKVAEDLYTKEESGQKYDAWAAFLGALGESGTGPALVVIQHLIESKKLIGDEAVHVISTLRYSAREPTLEYIHTLYALHNNPVVVQQDNLYNTVLLTSTDLMRKVFVHKVQSHNKFPVHSFGSFRTEKGKTFLSQTVIPDLKQKLDKAITQNQFEKAVLYISALGNTAHRDVLAVFEPYLEGNNDVTEFMRMWMIMSIDKMAKTNAVLARSFYFKIYQNLGYKPALRAIAFIQVWRTNPPKDLVHHMAEFTNIDTSKTVNAVVKSSMENAAELKGAEFEQLRSSAKSALHLLNKENFDTTTAHNKIQSFVLDGMNVMYKSTVQYVSNHMLKVAFRLSQGGLRNQWFIHKGLVSDYNQLLEVLYELTEDYKTAQDQAQKTQRGRWSSENIARLLNLKTGEGEPLQGSINLDMGSLMKFIPFTNQTLKHLPLMLQRLEEVLEKGKSLKLTRFMNRDEIAFSFPTEMGFPFLYTYDKPTLITVKGQIQASLRPKMSGPLIKSPESITGSLDLHTVASTKIAGKLSFITPFDHHQYIAGYDKVFQFNLPLRGKFDVNVNEEQIKVELQPWKPNQQINVLHASTWPFTSIHNILKQRPISYSNRIIRQRKQRVIDETFGKKEIGLGIHIKANYEVEQGITTMTLLKNLMKGDCVISQKQIQQSSFYLSVNPQESKSHKLTIHLGRQRKYKSQSDEDKHDLSHLYRTPSQSIARQQDFERKAGSNMRNAEVSAYDASFEFEGQDSFKYTFTAAIARSNVDPTSRIMFYFKRFANKENEPYSVAVSAKMHIPNNNEINIMDALKHEPVAKAQIHLGFGNKFETSSKVKVEVELFRNKATRQEISEDGLYHICNPQMREGNQHLPACANLTRRANRLDVMKVKVEHPNVDENVARWAKYLYNEVRFNLIPMVELAKKKQTAKDESNLEIRVNPEWRSLNVSMEIDDEAVKAFDVPLDLSFLFSKEKAYCVVDHFAVNTFNNRTYPMTLSDKWTVVMQYIPQVVRQGRQQTVEDQLRKQLYNYVVLTRQEQDKKFVKVVINTPETEGKQIEIDLKPSGRTAEQPRASVIIDSKPIKINDKESHDVKHGLVEVFVLNNGEVKIIVKHAFELVFDGTTLKVTLNNGKFQNSLRGICGQYNENPDRDLICPENCIMRDFQDFLQMYTIEEGKQRPSGQNHCSQDKKDKILFANVVSNIDAGRNAKYNEDLDNVPRACTILQTKYIEEPGYVCFTRRPYPACKCKQQGANEKKVSVHCVEESSVTNMWKKQIEEGLSPNFSNKPESKTLNIQVPVQCSM